MKKIISKISREIMVFIKHMDAEPDAKRPTTFWFYSNSEDRIYRLAQHLQEKGLKIEYCGPSASNNKQLLIAEKWMTPTEEMMNNFWTYFNELADRFGVEYDGWETRIDL